jgi:hypothetical protein
MKNKIESASLIVFEIMWVVLTYFIGRYIVHLMNDTGAIILIRDIIGAYFITWFIGAIIVLISWAYVCDKLDKK